MPPTKTVKTRKSKTTSPNDADHRTAAGNRTVLERILLGQGSELVEEVRYQELVTRLRRGEVLATLAANVVRLRLERDISRGQLSRLCEEQGASERISESSLWRIETCQAKSNPSLATLMTLSAVFKCTIIDFFLQINLDDLPVVKPASMNRIAPKVTE